MAPKKFGKYEVLARIATGGAANIFLSRQPGAAGFHKLVCLKTLLPERAQDADFVAMFLDEARLAARLNHPNCVQIYDLGRVRGSYYISMEYIFGETLWNLLATVTKLRTALPAPHVASIIASVCDGLHHAHELTDPNGRPYNLVHRDVSPQNVMITFEGQTKIVDFGIAKAETGRAPTSAGIVKGKFSYMSPEQITGASIDRRSDVYSLGIVLFECLASRRLYRGDTPEDIARLILEHRAPRLRDVVPEIPPALDSICATALARHPGKRFQSAHAMGEAIRDYLDSIRYTHSTAAIAKLVEERFRGQILDRRKIFEEALAGSYDEANLLKVLDARAARDIDLFPEETGTSTSDFVEPNLRGKGETDAHTGEVDRPNAETLQGEEQTADISERGLAVNPDLLPRGASETGTSGPNQPSISVMTDPEWPSEEEEEPEPEGQTRVDEEVMPSFSESNTYDDKGVDQTRIDLNGNPYPQDRLPQAKGDVDPPTAIDLGASAALKLPPHEAGPRRGGPESTDELAAPYSDDKKGNSDRESSSEPPRARKSSMVPKVSSAQLSPSRVSRVTPSRPPAPALSVAADKALNWPSSARPQLHDPVDEESSDDVEVQRMSIPSLTTEGRPASIGKSIPPSDSDPNGRRENTDTRRLFTNAPGKEGQVVVSPPSANLREDSDQPNPEAHESTAPELKLSNAQLGRDVPNGARRANGVGELTTPPGSVGASGAFPTVPPGTGATPPVQIAPFARGDSLQGELPQTATGSRFGPGALFTALGVGVAMGIVIGVLLARRIDPRPDVPVSIPATKNERPRAGK